MFCTECGTEVGGRATCPACGAVAPNAPGGPAAGSTPTGGPAGDDPTTTIPLPLDDGEPPIAPDDPASVDEEEGNGGKRKALLAAIAVLLVLVIGGAAFLFTQGSDGDDEVAIASDDTTTTVAEEPDETTTTESTTTTTTVPDEVPDYVGMSLSEAQALATDDGIDLKVVNVANDEEETGTILSQTPEAGSPFADQVVVNVARPAVLTSLTQFEVVEGTSPSDDSQTVNATTYTRALTYVVYESDAEFSGYDLGRAYTRFTASVGIADDASSGASAKFEVFGDGRLLQEASVGLGETGSIDVDVSGVLRLQIRVTGLTLSYSYRYPAVWGDPQLTSPPPADDAAVTTTTEP